jgi:hypothetical protein
MIAQALGHLGALFGGRERGQKERRENRDDGDHDEEFDEGEGGRCAECRMSNDEGRKIAEASELQSHHFASGFDIRPLGFLRDSEFGICHFHNAPFISSA